MLLAAWAVQQEEVVRGMAAPYAVYFCFSALIVPVLLSWYHDQSRLLAISLALAFTVFGWVRLPAEANTARLAMMFFLPLIFLLTEVFSEQRVLTRIGCLRIGLVVCAALGVAWMSGAKDGWWTALFAWGGGRSTWTWLPWAEQLSFAVGALLILFFAIRRRSKTEQAMLWALLAAFLGAHARKPEAMYFYYGTAGLVVMFAVMEHSAEITDRDELTGLPGRRALNRVLEQLGRRYALAMCDVDHFKRFNDTYGHETGDQVLRMVASRLSRVSGDSEVFRFGGEEFVIAFRGLLAEEAEPLADSVRKAIADAGFTIRGPNRPAERLVQGPLPASDKKTSVPITISIGLAEASSKDSSPEAVLRAADQALYQAKEAGRNCLWVAESARASGALAP
ncbi:MAG TPA: GGDEF domain-containing protein [Terriglobales bacterium]|nr:GGDEF domain-containing protein [Terriglobales bacterium]